MKEIKLIKTSDKIIGNIRVSMDIFWKIENLAKKHKVTKQDIIKAVLVNFIDEANFT